MFNGTALCIPRTNKRTELAGCAPGRFRLVPSDGVDWRAPLRQRRRDALCVSGPLRWTAWAAWRPLAEASAEWTGVAHDTDETSRETPTLTPTYLKMDSTGLAELLMRMEDNRREDQRRMEKNQLRMEEKRREDSSSYRIEGIDLRPEKGT